MYKHFTYVGFNNLGLNVSYKCIDQINHPPKVGLLVDLLKVTFQTVVVTLFLRFDGGLSGNIYNEIVFYVSIL